ncbi:MAG: hypothetical protein AAF682_15455 [Planctomycetota bacterium]
MDDAPSFDDLAARVPELLDLEREAREVQDPGGSLFCANNTWFRFARRLRELIGVWRRSAAGESAEEAAFLAQGLAYEAAFARIYPQLPACRSCGCQLFEAHRREDLAAADAASGDAEDLHDSPRGSA